MDTQAQGSGTEALSARLESAAANFVTDAEASATAASEMLDTVPGQPQALLLLLSALKIMGAEDDACGFMEWMVGEYPNLAAVHYELALLLSRKGRSEEAIEHLTRTVALEPSHPAAWRALGNELAEKGDRTKATRAYARHASLSVKELKLLEDATATGVEDLKAKSMLQQALNVNPTDVLATRMLGELALRMSRLREAAEILKRALDLAPRCTITRELYATALTQLMDWKGANAQARILLEEEPGNPRLEALLASNLVMLGEREEAIRHFHEVQPNADSDVVFWLNYGHAARAIGLEDSIIVNAYRKCLELEPSYGSAWWGLADLKTYQFSTAEIANMREQLRSKELSDGLRCHLEFALGTALEKEGEYAESFEHYRCGNELRRPYISYNADGLHEEVKQQKKLFTPKFFAERPGTGCQSPAPIFIVGMPRAGSTLIEQILASHSQVEGTMELPDMGNMVGELIQQHRGSTFADVLPSLDGPALRELGESYLERTRYQRKQARPFFTDKGGNNFLYIGLIQLILPNAKIIDARRHPLACGFSCYKQAFAPGALLLAYDQTEIGRYYRDYVELTAHYDKVLPGRVHRVIHENLISDPDAEIRRLLAFCDLPFEESCVRFHETERSVRTSSSQQVRQPIQKKKIEVWQHYEQWLQPMKDAIGDVLPCYPDVPEFS
ncbi:MAG TPA: sulfotransferase [Rhizomicrobium sp.]|jgi:tetratricopeptide (TPR) repeat protein|nr:sulfotransferase [Rhizomicrobium sp.]